jgi:hypothetical protein
VRATSPVLTAAIATGAFALLVGCGQGSQGSPSVLLPLRTPQARSLSVNALPLGSAKPPKELAVADSGVGLGEIEFLNSSYVKEKKVITDGINSSADVYYDHKGNLYVANFSGPYVTEYDKKRTLTFTYSSELTAPISITTDGSNNVYAADNGTGLASVVVEYPQGNNTPVATCATGLENTGIAVDGEGNVFVAGINYNIGDPPVTSLILEYKGGLKGCKPTILGVKLVYSAGMRIDNKGDLVVCDQNSTPSAVEIIPPPYKSIKSTISVQYPYFAYHVAFTKSYQLIFIVEAYVSIGSGAHTNVLVDEYPSGKNVTTLDASNGLTLPTGVAALPPV